jgi:predicted AlkP superfamily phosphohydrolase/phosphomutase
VIVIGLDGGTLRLLRPMVERGELPNLARLMDRGVWGELASTVPPVTAPAWATFATGTNPGKHGVFDFQIEAPGQEQRTWISSQDVLGSKFWELLAQNGLRTGLINLPLTYPPQPIQGFTVSGMLTPSLSSQFTFPAELQREVLQVAPDYVTDVDLLTSEWHYHDLDSLNELVDRLSQALEQRHLLMRYLADERTWDVLVFVITELDRVQHLMFKLLTNSEVSGEWADLRRRALDLYRQADEAIGTLSAKMDEQTVTFIVSDHGFGPLNKRLNLNAWLASQGWLQFSGSKSWIRKTLKQIAKKSGLDRWVPQKWRANLRKDLSAHACIDWPATVAYSGTPLEQGIRINLRGREPQGVVVPGTPYETLCDEIAGRLVEIRDPETKAPIIDQVYRREDLYQGSEAARAPDLIFSLNDYQCNLSEGLPDQRLFEPFPFPWAGYHDPNGILVMAGGPVQQAGYRPGANIADIAPTILHLLGTPIPRRMDGRVLGENFTAEWLAQHEIAYQETDPQEQALAEQDSYTDQDAEQIEERLRSLGYLG